MYIDTKHVFFLILKKVGFLGQGEERIKFPYKLFCKRSRLPNTGPSVPSSRIELEGLDIWTNQRKRMDLGRENSRSKWAHQDYLPGFIPSMGIES